MQHSNSQAILLRQQNLVFVTPSTDQLPEQYVRGLELQLSALGYLPTYRLRIALLQLSLKNLNELQAWLWTTLAEALGANQKHTPLFRRFPEDIPEDTYSLWVKRVLCYFYQGKEQACVFCKKTGTTHVLNPCQHIVCDQCFDGSNYSGCPICNQKVDASSPFFTPSPDLPLPKERVQFKLLELGEDLDTQVQLLFVSYCERKQALSPVDQANLKTIILDYKEEVLSWLPEKIPVKEVIATIFATLSQIGKPEEVFPVAKKYLATATDVLRLIAAYSGADPSLQKQASYRQIQRGYSTARWWGKALQSIKTAFKSRTVSSTYVSMQVSRFKVAKLSRPLRRSLLALLEEMNPDSLTEDMLRHQSLWVWVGQFLHPHEYAKHFPKVTRAFQVVREKAPDGTKAPAFQGYYSKLEEAAKKQDAVKMLALLRNRPGEFARRFDFTMRTAKDNSEAQEQILSAFKALAPSFSTPVLLTLRSLLPTRTTRAKVRIYWPKGQISKGVSSPDRRALLTPKIVTSSVSAIDAALLERFAKKPALDAFILDKKLQKIIVPFNERTASPAAISLPRGSQVFVPKGKVARLFLHWCQPEKGGIRTDIDLSVGFYDASWKYVGVCSYYQLSFAGKNKAQIAKSSGDFTSAPFPNGASEFVDIHRENANQNEIRYAVMVVNNYSGMPFSHLERAFAGLMLRDDVGGQHFDPRTVTLKFSLQGENGIFMPVVFDIKNDTLHWLDVYSKGELAMNNVESSNAAITKICPEMIEYFGSGVRCSMYDLALLHAASRSARVFIRDEDCSLFIRKEGESNITFYERIRQNRHDEKNANLPTEEEPAVFAALYEGDLQLYPSGQRYVLFPGEVSSTIAASDLLS
jgi:hypothetical protein